MSRKAGSEGLVIKTVPGGNNSLTPAGTALGTTGISAFPLGWPWEAQSSPQVARKSWGLRSSHCRAEETSPRRVSVHTQTPTSSQGH